MRKDIETYLGRVKDDIHNLADGCAHLEAVTAVSPSSADSCQECVAIGASWSNLRICLECGHVGCCDTSLNQHARRHYEASGHSMILSYEPRELWMYCFEDDMIFVAPE
jgi:CPA2 family monovalent cation:H+ antiporter-2